MSAILALMATVLTAVLFPVVGALIIVAILMLQILFMAVRLLVGPSIEPKVAPSKTRASAVFSIHVATHNEPHRMVCETLRALDGQNWPLDRYEVVIIDNNTSDPDLWRPVQSLCRHLGPHFRFFHRMDVEGAKAGALNIALANTRIDATHIVTVDADYVVHPDFLAQAAHALAETGADYVQFPQAYLACETVAAGIDAELEEYFRTHARMADGSDAVLLTGTLCVMSKAALVAAGGWSGLTTTEDAEIGVRLCRKGYGGRFIDRVVGRGYLPLSLQDLERQRHRWASGNLQTLIAHAPAVFLGRDGMGWRRRGAILSQLTAWLNLSLLPALVLFTTLLTGLGGELLPPLAAASVLLTIVDIVARLVWRGLRDGKPTGTIAAAICNRLALAPISALATLQTMVGRAQRFVVTDKSGNSQGRHGGLPVAALALFVAAAITVLTAEQTGTFVMLAVFALMTPFPAALVTARTLERYRTALIGPDAGASS